MWDIGKKKVGHCEIKPIITVSLNFSLSGNYWFKPDITSGQSVFLKEDYGTACCAWVTQIYFQELTDVTFRPSHLILFLLVSFLGCCWPCFLLSIPPVSRGALNSIWTHKQYLAPIVIFSLLYVQALLAQLQIPEGRTNGCLHFPSLWYSILEKLFRPRDAPPHQLPEGQCL